MSREDFVQFQDFAEREQMSIFVAELKSKSFISIETLNGNRFIEELQKWVDGDKYRVWFYDLTKDDF